MSTLDSPSLEVRWDGPRATLLVDGAESSCIDTSDPTYLDFEYMQHATCALQATFPSSAPLRVLHLGGAACALPWAWSLLFPSSRHTVVEISPKIASFARETFDLPRSPIFEALPLMSLSATHLPGNLSPLSCEPLSSLRSVIAFFAKVVFCWPTARTEVVTTHASIWQVCGRASQMSKPCATPKSGAEHDEEISSSSLSIRRNPLTRPSSTVFFASFLFPLALCAAKTYRSGRLGRGP